MNKQEAFSYYASQLEGIRESGVLKAERIITTPQSAHITAPEVTDIKNMTHHIFHTAVFFTGIIIQKCRAEINSDYTSTLTDNAYHVILKITHMAGKCTGI